MLKALNEKTYVLEWNENITLKNVELFRQEMNKLLNYNAKQLMLDLVETSYINSAGLGIIAESVIQARRNNKELVIANIQPSIHEIFSIVKFSTFIKLFESKEEAIQHFEGN